MNFSTEQSMKDSESVTLPIEPDLKHSNSIPLPAEHAAAQSDRCRRIHFPEIIRSHHMLSAKPVNDVYHMHDSYELLMFLDGCTDCYIEHHRYRLKRGDLLIINSQEIHRAVSYEGTPYERIATHFSPELVRNHCTDQSDLLSCFEKRKNADRNLLSLSPKSLELYLSLTDHLHTAVASASFGHDILASTYLLQILVLANTCFYESTWIPENIMPQLSSQIMRYIDDHLTEDLSIQALADRLYMNRSHMSRKFREQAGCSIQEYMILKRISLAKTLLKQGKSVTDTCELSGFHDYSNFIRTFKKYAQISPGHYRIAAMES